MKNLQGFVCTAAVLLTLAAPRGAAAAGVETRLADAAMKRDIAAVRALIAQKVDVNAPGTDGSPALHWAVRVDDAAMAQVAARRGRTAVAHQSLRADADGDRCSQRQRQLIGILLDAGADANAPDPAGDTPLMSVTRVGRPMR